MFENEKQTQLGEMFSEKYPYLNPNSNNEKILLIHETNMNKKIITKYIQHDFKGEIQNCVFSSNRLKYLIFEINIQQDYMY